MSDLTKLGANLAELDRRLEAEKIRDQKKAVREISRLMDQNELTLKDLERLLPPARRGVSQSRGPVPAKYRDPISGAVWSGRGTPPKWIAAARAAGKDAKFLIANQEKKRAASSKGALSGKRSTKSTAGAACAPKGRTASFPKATKRIPRQK